MNGLITFENAVRLGGLLHLGILTAGPTMVRVLDWKANLKKLQPMTEHIIRTHDSFVWLIICGFGLVSLLQAPALTTGEPLARSVSAFIAVFWGIRLLIQFFYFYATAHLTRPALKLGYYGLTLCFAYFTLVYGMAVIR